MLKNVESLLIEDCDIKTSLANFHQVVRLNEYAVLFVQCICSCEVSSFKCLKIR